MSEIVRELEQEGLSVNNDAVVRWVKPLLRMAQLLDFHYLIIDTLDHVRLLLAYHVGSSNSGSGTAIYL